MKINSIDKILKGAAVTMLVEAEELKSNVLAETARLVNEKKLSKEIIEEEVGHYALCHITKNEETIKEFSFNQQCQVGRAKSLNDLDISTDDKWLSKSHFKIVVNEDGVPIIEDLESINGTYVNDIKFNERKILHRGDCIRAGHSIFIFL